VDTKTVKQMETLLSKSIEERAINLMIKGIDAIEAVKQAIIEEQKFIEEMIAQQTERSVKAKNQICKNVYGLIHLIN
tara:strand:- start:230 stop:460 length:231 start_codon:yes stop_codon:yes gene_type:complete